MARRTKRESAVAGSPEKSDPLLVTREGVPRAYVTFLVKDLDRTVDFYDDAFDIVMFFTRDPSGRELALGDTGRTGISVVTWELIDNSGLGPSPYMRRDAPEVRLIIPTNNLEAAVAKATAAGAVLIDRYHTRLEDVACLSDPDGFLIELRQPVVAPPGWR